MVRFSFLCFVVAWDCWVFSFGEIGLYRDEDEDTGEEMYSERCLFGIGWGKSTGWWLDLFWYHVIEFKDDDIIENTVKKVKKGNSK